MSPRFLVSLGVLAAFAAAPVVAQAPKSASPKSKTWVMPRTPDGHPDLQGFWTNATLTPMDRPAAFAGKATVSDAEASSYEKKDLETNDIDKQDAPLLANTGSGGVGGYNNLFIDRGTELARVDGVKRTSLIVDPPDGHAPPLSDAARANRGRGGAGFGNRYDSIADRPLAERCIIGFSSVSGPPMMPVLYNSNYQFVQTGDNIMILSEMVHDVRTIRMNGTHLAKGITQWLGDSIGHWEGDTLVVDTTNFNDKTRFRGTGANLHTIERFKRVDAGTILYRVTIDDPMYSKPWTMEYPFRSFAGPLFEYACHEGNYAMPDILGGARRQEAEAAGAKK